VQLTLVVNYIFRSLFLYYYTTHYCHYSVHDCRESL